MRWFGASNTDHKLKSCLCSQELLESEPFQAWAQQLKERQGRLHRKIWEYAYIAQALYERGMLAEGQRGLGFAVGKEPLVALFATYGCELLVTDLERSAAESSTGNWAATNQHAACLEEINERRICDMDVFMQRVRFRPVDMNQIPSDLRGYDFCWSSCAMEHLGSIARGIAFIHNMLDCLRPGGIAVHTTEFNVSSNWRTLDECGDVLFRRRDIMELARWLRREGHQIELDLRLGKGEADRCVDRPPFKEDPHLRLELGGFVSTSLGLIITKRGA